MSDNYFLEQNPEPDTASIKAALGDKYPWFAGVLEAAGDFEREWKHYGRKYGWKLKAHDGDKALFELTVAAGSFRLGLAVRESEVQALKADPSLSPELAALLAETRKEGWGIRLVVEDEAKYRQACALIKAVAAIRENG
ncbi:MAG: DUF3788 family protein [Spirochaetaceae bacterium]|nr:DUF3788 family protein [Spirochaetaceae bacterium]